MKDNQIKNTIALQLLKYHIGGASVLCIFFAILYLLYDQQLQFLFISLEENGGFSFIGVLDVQISVSFIVVSIVTIFAQKNITIYWEDIMQYKLIRPKYTNFNAMASYIFIDLIASITFIIMGSRYTYISFFISIILIMLLSLKMLAAFFSGDLIRAELEKVYLQEKNNRSTDKSARKSYREHKRRLIQYTIQAIEDNEIDIVCENMYFLYKFEEDEDSLYLIQKMASDNKIYMVSRVAKVCQFIFNLSKHVQEYDNICRSIISNSHENVNGYIVSIYKSMGEYTSENSPNMFAQLNITISNFCEYCNNCGEMNLAETIQSCYEDQSRCCING